MKHLDYHLESYEVSDRGESVAFNLVYGYPGEETDKNIIKFRDWETYNPYLPVLLVTNNLNGTEPQWQNYFLEF